MAPKVKVTLTQKGKAIAKKSAGKRGAAPTAKAKAKGKSYHESKMKSLQMRRQLEKLSKSQRPYPQIHYKNLQGHEAKREFARKLELDPQCSFLQAEETEYVRSKDETKVIHGPMYVWDVAKLNGLQWRPNDKAIEEVMAAILDGVPTEESDNSLHRKKGDLLYQYKKSMMSSTKEAVKSVALKNAELDEGQYYESVAALKASTKTRGGECAQQGIRRQQKQNKK